MTEGYEPNYDLNHKRVFDETRKWGEEGEAHVRALFDAVRPGLYEVKRDAQILRPDANLFVETHQRDGCNPNGRWRPSGLSVTTSRYYAFVLGETLSATLIIPVADLKRWIDLGQLSRADCVLSDCPTKGWLLPWQRIVTCLRYDAGHDVPNFPRRSSKGNEREGDDGDTHLAARRLFDASGNSEWVERDGDA